MTTVFHSVEQTRTMDLYVSEPGAGLQICLRHKQFLGL